MREMIEKLLLLQECDRRILHLRSERDSLAPRRQTLQSKAAGSQANQEAVRHKGLQIESDRKKLELEVEAQKQLIEKYSLQQYQTKKNDEFRALAHEIETCKAAIVKLDDEQLELMEQAEAAQRETVAATRTARELKAAAEMQIAELTKAEADLSQQLAALETEREQLVANVDESLLGRYDRLLKQKGSNVIVGIQHGVCGGCHMQLSRQTVVTCRASEDLVACTNCGRILYYTRDMDLAVAE